VSESSDRSTWQTQRREIPASGLVDELGRVESPGRAGFSTRIASSDLDFDQALVGDLSPPDVSDRPSVIATIYPTDVREGEGNREAVAAQSLSGSESPLEDEGEASSNHALPVPDLREAKYAFRGLLAQGGMGRLFLADDRDLERQVVIKTVFPDRLQDPIYQERFVQEAQTTGRLQHPNIVPIHDLGVSRNGSVYFTMPLIRGRTLSRIITELSSGDEKTHEEFSFVTRLQLIQQICEAIEYAHANGIVHRDLKPDNIMVGPFGEVLVMDWGLARLIRYEAEDANLDRVAGIVSSESFLARDRRIASNDRGFIVGTPHYMAPEQIGSVADEVCEPDPRSDIFAIGAIMYEMFALFPPFDGSNVHEILENVRSMTPVPPESLRFQVQKRVPREISLIAMRALEKDPEIRFPSARAMKNEIRSYLEGQARVVCVQTGFKRGLFVLGTFVDNYHRLAIGTISFMVLFPWTLLLLLYLSFS